MRKVHIICLIIAGITASNLQSVNCNKHIRSRRDEKEVIALNDKNNGKVSISNYNDHEDDQPKSTLDSSKDITLELSEKIKRDTPDFPWLNNNDSSKNTPLSLIATIADENDTEILSYNEKIKRNLSVNDPVKAQKLRQSRDKKFMCLCEETKCRNKECLKNQLQSQTSQQRTEEDENNSAEVFVNDVNVIQKTFVDEPKKFTIPFANNVNFDQRVIVGAKNSQAKSPSNTFYPIYPNPQLFQYSPYTLAHPGLIYTGVAPIQQNYAPTVSYNQFPSPSPIPAHFLKLWKNGAQDLLPVGNNPKPTPEYVPNYSSENTKKEPATDSNKVTTPRQVNGNLYPHNYPSETDSSYSHPTYTTEVVSADDYHLNTDTSMEMKHLAFGDPTTTNYAPDYYSTNPPDVNNHVGLSSNQGSHLQNQFTSENAVIAANSYENPNMPHYDYNGLPFTTMTPGVYTDNPYIEHKGYQSQEDPYNQINNDDLNIAVDRVINDYRNNPSSMSVPSDSDLKAYDPPALKPYNSYNPSQNPATPKPYNSYNPPQNPTSTKPFQSYNQPRDFVIHPPASYSLENTNSPRKPPINPEVYKNYPSAVTTLQEVNNDYTPHHNPQRTSTLRNADGYKSNGAVATANADPDHMEQLFRGLEQIILNNDSVSDVPQIQAIDERPSTTYENTYRNNNADNTIVQNAVKKVLNNFVPGKSQDLLANYYGTERSRELSRKNAERLSPDLTNTQVVLKNLLNVPEVENMIVDTTSNLVNQLTDMPVPRNMIKDTLRNVVSEIPRPTTAPPPRNDAKNKMKLAKRLPRYDDSADREVFEKIKTIIDKSRLGEEAATHPLAQNLIVKTVKYSLDKEKGVVDEATIRRAFNELFKSRKSTGNSYISSGKPLIVQPKETTNSHEKVDAQETYTNEDTGYKLAPVIPVTERRLQGGVWIEAPKKLAGNRVPLNTPLEEKRRKELEKKLDMLQKYGKSNFSVNPSDERHYETTSQNFERKSDVSTRDTIPKYYVTSNPQVYPQANGYNILPAKPAVTTINYQNYRDPMYTTQQPNNNRLNLLVEATPSTNEPDFMGKLVPVNSVVESSGNSKLVWIGDGVKLPLTTRKMSDGSYALTLSDEICQMFAHKKCPCCLPDAKQGIITRDTRNDEQDYSDDAAKLLSNKQSGNYRVRRDSGEVPTTSIKTFSNAIGKHDDNFNDEDYEDSTEKESTGPYKYQQYASLDKIISGSTKALGNILKFMKNVVTEAHEKILRRRTNATTKQS